MRKQSIERHPYRLSGIRASLVWVAALLACLVFGAARAAGTGWQQLSLSPPIPLSRFGHVFSTVNGVALLYGGSTPSITGPGTVALTDLWQFSPATGSFTRLNSITGSPPTRTGHAAAEVDGYLYVFFGAGADGSLLSDVWLWDGIGVCWRLGEYPQPGVTRPAPRMDHTAVATNNHTILIFGGHGGADGTTLLDDLWSFRPSDQSWTQKAPFPGGGRAGHSAVWLGGKMLVLGGVSAAGVQNDVWSYDPASDAWTQLTSTGSVPGGFTGATAAVADFLGTGTPLLLLTGGTGADNTDLVGSYRVDPDGMGHANWTALSDGPAITGARGVAVSVSPGAAPLWVLFGGTRAGAPLAEAWVYGTGAPQAPNAPSGLTVSVPAAGGNGALSLRWTDNSADETGFVVQRAFDQQFTAGLTTLAVQPVNATAVTDIGLLPNTRYFYRVKATGIALDSAYSATAGGTTLPNPPTGLTATANSPSQVTVTWTDADPGLLGFHLERRAGAGNYTQIAAPNSADRQYVDYGVSARNTYTYRLRATGPSGDSGYSPEASATPPAAPSGKLKVAGSVTFRSTTVGSAGTFSLALSNTSKTDSLQVTITAPATPFSCPSAPSTFLLPPRGSQSLALGFTPTAKGKFRGTLTLQTSDPAKKTAKVKLAGKGI